MGKLDEVPMARLREELARVEGAKAAKRLMVAIAYKDGVSVGTLSDRYGIPESTVYHWLDRFEAAPVAEAIADDTSPGRPPKLSAAQRERVGRWLQRSPAAQGLDGDEWTPERLRDRIETAFGVEYSLGHVRRLLRNADITE